MIDVLLTVIVFVTLGVLITFQLSDARPQGVGSIDSRRQRLRRSALSKAEPMREMQPEGGVGDSRRLRRGEVVHEEYGTSPALDPDVGRAMGAPHHRRPSSPVEDAVAAMTAPIRERDEPARLWVATRA